MIPMHSPSVSLEVTKYQLLKQWLLSEYPQSDDDTLRDTLEGITELHDMIAAVIRCASGRSTADRAPFEAR
jgi:hypothetical protein